MFHVFSHQIFRLQFGGGIMSTTQRKSLELRSEEHTSELQSQSNLVCRLLLEKKKIDDVLLDVSDVIIRVFNVLRLGGAKVLPRHLRGKIFLATLSIDHIVDNHTLALLASLLL